MRRKLYNIIRIDRNSLLSVAVIALPVGIITAGYLEKLKKEDERV